MNIRVAVLGRSYDKAAGVPEQLELPRGGTIDDALSALAKLLGEENRLPPSCLVAVSGQHLGTIASHASHALSEGDELVLFAPVAGG